MLDIQHINVFYPFRIQVLEEISMMVKERQIVVLLGRKGAGKTTILKAVSGLLEPEGGRVAGGTIRFKGESILHLPPRKIIQKGMILVLGGRQEFKQMTVEENLRAGTASRRSRSYGKDLEMVYSYFPTLLSRRKVLAGRCSSAELQMVAIGRAMMSDPQLLLIDEPSLGLAPLLVKEVFRVLQGLNREQGKTVLLGGQNMNMALQIADYAYMLEGGRVAWASAVESLRQEPAVTDSGLFASPLNNV